MTVVRVHEIPKYIGLSTDSKPSDAMCGSEFWERDTQRTYVVYEKIAGVAQWVAKE